MFFPVYLLSICVADIYVRSQELTFEVSEESPPGILGNIASKANLSSVLGHVELQSLQYTVVEDVADLGHIFDITERTGVLSLRTALDREALCGVLHLCVVSCDVAVQSFNPDSAFFRKFKVVVIVLDINDNPPVFDQSSFVVNIPENVMIDTEFLLPTATDADMEPTFRVQQYTLEPQFPEFDLRVSRTSTPLGEVTFSVNLKVSRFLDREHRDLYMTSLLALDGGQSPKSSSLPLSIVIVDTNDNSPKFKESRYAKSIREDSEVGLDILVVSAMDLDEGDNGRVSYTMAKSSQIIFRKMFRINENTGTIFIQHALNGHGGRVYDFEVVARDNGVPRKSSVCYVKLTILDTNNDRPETKIRPLFSHGGAAVVPETAAIGRVIALLTILDQDTGRNGLVTCQLDHNYFSLQKLELNEYKVIVASNLDREQLANHTINIRCTDAGDPPLTSERSLSVEVSDSNDNAPSFTANNYILAVPENQVIGTWVGRVTAVDVDDKENAALVYGMKSAGETFTIDAFHGDIYTARLLDREVDDSHTFIVHAYDKSDKPLSAQTTVVVNVADRNDHKPIFINGIYRFKLVERTPPGSLIGKVRATDADIGLNARVEYYMVTSYPRHILPIGVNSSGAVLVIGHVDYDITSVFQFMVSAVDLGSPPQNTSCRVIVEVVDTNDHSPVITFPSLENPSVSVSADLAPGAEIAKVLAYDLDSGPNGELRYNLSVANASAVLLIDQLTGVISLGKQKLATDVNMYNIFVSVRDNGAHQLSQVALLRVNVASPSEPSDTISNIQIVIVLVCITTILSMAVILTLLLIRCLDRKRKNFREEHRHEILTKSSYQSDKVPEKTSSGTRRTATLFTSHRQGTTLYSPKKERASVPFTTPNTPKCSHNNCYVSSSSNKKTVSFERDSNTHIREEGSVDCGGDDYELRQPVSGDFYPVQVVGDQKPSSPFSTFKPSKYDIHRKVSEDEVLDLFF